MAVTVPLETDEARAAVEAAGSAGGRLVIVPRINGRYSSVGVIAEILEVGRVSNGPMAAVVRGEQRALIGAAVPATGQALWVAAEPVPVAPASPLAHEIAREYRAVLENLLIARGAREIANHLREVTEPDQIADVSGYSPDLSLAEKVEVLETTDLESRLELVLGWAREALADLALRERVKSNVEDGLERTQREFLLRRQLEAIQHELGELSGSDAEQGTPEAYREAVSGRDLPDAVERAVLREIDKLERTSDQSPERGWTRAWLDTVLELPWGVESPDVIDVAEASRILDADHDGLRDVKDRILEHLAVHKLQADRGFRPVGRQSGAILALVGPPGVGKTSLGESVAHALGRQFVRVALGGVRDEAEIRGHRRTYVGAQPGRFVRAIKEAGSMNPVIMLDEVDKVGSDFRGDPASALLEVLDPAQNHTFTDHYLEVALDLSQVMFVATANVVDTIPAALLDRMEVIRLDGYTEDEKVAIAQHHLVPRQVERAALVDSEIEITEATLRRIISDYTREAGVRALERELGRLLRKVVMRLSTGSLSAPVLIDEADLSGWLGRARFYFEAADRASVPGVATGLAVTGSGGDVLFVEATAMPGREGLTLTGQLGDVMKESAEIALSYVRSHTSELRIPDAALRDRHFHVHVPAGAVPKDGPSAGVTITTALVSLLTGAVVRPIVGMTGEVTLQGKVLPIGGVKQKVLAARRSELREVVLPARNEGDLEDLPQAVRDEMIFHFANDISEVLSVALATEEVVDKEGVAA